MRPIWVEVPRYTEDEKEGRKKSPPEGELDGRV